MKMNLSQSQRKIERRAKSNRKLREKEAVHQYCQNNREGGGVYGILFADQQRREEEDRLRFCNGDESISCIF